VSGHAGKFSTEFCAAVALVFGEVGIATFDDRVLSDPVVLGIIERIEIVERPELALGELTARLRLRSGEAVEASRRHPRGSRLDPLSRPQRIAKLRGCLAYGGVGPLAEELIACVERLETTHDVSELGTLLRASM
jgi:2-methylcitrate dehydratase PrpD